MPFVDLNALWSQRTDLATLLPDKMHMSALRAGRRRSEHSLWHAPPGKASMNPAYHRDLFHRIRELTIRTVECMPPDKIFFKPENSRTFAEIVLHVVESQYHILNKIADRDDRPPQALTTDNYSTREALAGLLRDEQARTLEILGGLTAEALAEVVPSPFGNGDLCIRDYWVEILILHEVDHKGNLVIMAKCCGADPPDVVRLSKEGDDPRAREH